MWSRMAGNWQGGSKLPNGLKPATAPLWATATSGPVTMVWVANDYKIGGDLRGVGHMMNLNGLSAV